MPLAFALLPAGIAEPSFGQPERPDMQNAKSLLLAFAFLISTTPVFVQAAPSTAKPNPSAQEWKTEPPLESRKQMALAHKKMADCLASTRPFNECHEEMRTSMMAMREKMGGACCGDQNKEGGAKGHPHGDSGGWH
jgi:hypothetical protein